MNFELLILFIYLFIYLLNLSTTEAGRQDKSVGTWKFGTWGGWVGGWL
jgi:hypothetical protein